MARPFGKADHNGDAANNRNFNYQRRMLKKPKFSMDYEWNLKFKWHKLM